MVKILEFGKIKTGEMVNKYIITNANGSYVEIIDYGCKICKIVVPNKNKELVNVCLGYDTLDEYVDDGCFLGTAVGRYANRIANGKFTINGVEYKVDLNEDGVNNLHGGYKNFSNCVWKLDEKGDDFVKFTRKFVDMEGGFPGNITAYITYQWSDSNELLISYEATTDKDTVINMTNHSYFNLSGDYTKEILDHEVIIYTDKYTPVNEKCIPLDGVESVIGTPFDFTTRHKIGERIDCDNEQLRIGKGYDHNYAFDNLDDKLMAEVFCEESGISLKCYSCEPGIQLYTGNNLVMLNKDEDKFKLRTGLCLETQKYPDSPNNDKFPSALVKAFEKYSSYTKYEFGVE